MPIPQYMIGYLKSALAATPDLLSHLLLGVHPDSLDAHVDEDRFSIREVVCHLSDWDEIILNRVKRMVTEQNPILEDIDEGQVAIDRNYGDQDIDAKLASFRMNREDLIIYLAGLNIDDWDRTAVKEPIGTVTVQQIISIYVAHDLYHLEQISRYRRATEHF